MPTAEDILKSHIISGQKEIGVIKDNEFDSEDYKLTEKYICKAMQEHTNLHLDKFAEFVESYTEILEDRGHEVRAININDFKQLLTEYKNKLK